jgi:hypothetical protein
MFFCLVKKKKKQALSLDEQMRLELRKLLLERMFHLGASEPKKDENTELGKEELVELALDDVFSLHFLVLIFVFLFAVLALKKFSGALLRC